MANIVVACILEIFWNEMLVNTKVIRRMIALNIIFPSLEEKILTIYREYL